MNVAGQSVVGAHSAFPREVFDAGLVRPTVQALVCHNRRQILMTRSARAPQHLKWWIPPQEGINVEETVVEAVARGLKEELGICIPSNFLDSAQILGCYDNPLPSARMGIPKRIVAVGIPLFKIEKITLDRIENTDYTLVSSWEELHVAMADVAARRIRKYVNTCEAVVAACKCGLLSWEIPGEDVLVRTTMN